MRYLIISALASAVLLTLSVFFGLFVILNSKTIPLAVLTTVHYTAIASAAWCLIVALWLVGVMLFKKDY